MEKQKNFLGRLHSIETFGTLDGPGIRVVLFCQGCPLRCAYCHNRDTWEKKGGTMWTAGDLKDFIMRYEIYMERSGGGVTASGGEPLLQHRFLESLFGLLKRENIHTALDTSGYMNPEEVLGLLAVTDLVILDIKAMNPRLHARLTGRDNALILDFARYLDKIKKPAWIRHVVVPGYTDTKESLSSLRDFIGTLSNVQRVELLPYHTMGKYKWINLGCDYPLEGVLEPTAAEMARAYEIMGLKNIK